MGFVLVLLGASASMITLLFYCQAGSSITVVFEELADTAYQSKWYKYDNKLKKYLIPFIANCQVPLKFDGLKMVYLSLQTFSKVKFITLLYEFVLLILFSSILDNEHIGQFLFNV